MDFVSHSSGIRTLLKSGWRGLFIVRIALKYRLDEIIFSSTDHPILQQLIKPFTWRYKANEPRGKRLRLALQDLGPLFVKFGQMLSTRRDLLASDIADELAFLQDRVPPFDSDVAIRIIEEAFRKPLAELFVAFDKTPAASASIAQVHFAQIRHEDGKIVDVAVKVLRPQMQKIIQKDLNLLKIMAHWLHRLSFEAKRLKPLEVVAEFEKHLHNELDLLREGSNAALLKRNMQNLTTIIIPDIYWNYCRTNVLVMQRMYGVPIGQMEPLKQAGVSLPQLAERGINIFFTQVFCDGFFHADLHPGNILISLDKATFGHYILLDFGIVGSLTQTDKEYLTQNFAAFFRRDYAKVAQLHVESGWVPPKTRVDELEATIRTVCEPYFDRPLHEISLGMVLMRLFQASRQFGVEIQPQLVLLQKTLLNVEGLARELDPNMDLWATAKPFLERWMNEQTGPKALFNRLKNNAPEYVQLLPELPLLVAQALKSQQTHLALAQELQKLRDTQTQTNELLKRYIYLSIGFMIGIFLAIIGLVLSAY